jgi:predicted nucleic acid-binding protein
VGSAGQLIAVTDAGPLIHLHEIGQLGLLRIFNLLHVTEDVWAEATSSARVPADALAAATSFKLHSVSTNDREQFASQHHLQHLQIGELTALQLCAAADIRVLLTDDLAARDAAKSMNVVPVGSVGIVLRAYHTGTITLPHAEQALTTLFDTSTLFVTRTIIDLAIEQLRLSPPI